MTSYQIENIIASSNLNTSLDLDEVAKRLDDSDYNPDNFPGVIWRPRNSYAVVVIMNDGKLMCTNVRSLQEVESLFKKLTKKLEESGVITPRKTCPNCGAVVDSEDMVCIECGYMLQH
ncbi:MAG: zinc ribbon domain-containing protein [Thermoplasmatota archaeon]